MSGATENTVFFIFLLMKRKLQSELIIKRALVKLSFLCSIPFKSVLVCVSVWLQAVEQEGDNKTKAVDNKDRTLTTRRKKPNPVSIREQMQ